MTTEFNKLKQQVHDMLQDESGCSWLLEQDWRSIANYSQEEIYELIDAIERKDFSDVKDELADMCFHLLIYAQMGEKEGRFSLEDIAATALQKQASRRLPENEVQDAKLTHAHWQKQKHKDKLARNKSLFKDIPNHFPALLQAKKLQDAASQIGFEFSTVQEAWGKLEEEQGELLEAMQTSDKKAVEHELGDLLFACTSIARGVDLNPEECLRAANARFKQRLLVMEVLADTQGVDFSSLSRDRLEALYKQAKSELIQE